MDSPSTPSRSQSQQQQQQQQQQQLRIPSAGGLVANPTAGGGAQDPAAPPAQKVKQLIVVRSPTIDLDVYIANYTGVGRINRLEFIAAVCPELRVDALRIALADLKATMNVPRYHSILSKLNEELRSRGLPETAADSGWMESTQRSIRAKTDRLETELRNYKTNLIKESIRMGHQDLGDHYASFGDYTSALRFYSRTRDYCTTPKHMIDMCFNVIKISLETQNYVNVQSYVSKAEGITDVADRTLVLSKLKCCSGLVHLANGKFKSAARSFLDVSFQMNNGFSEVLSANDVATYGSLCALASFERSELKNKVFDNSEFKQYLELEPQIREILELFYSSKYGQCLSLLAKMRDDFLLDIHLQEHLDAIYSNIRRTALVQYFSPFLSVDLSRMAKSFNTDVASLEAELAALIVNNSIAARIDSHNKVLRIKRTDQRTAVFEKTIKMGHEHQKQARHLMLRISLMRQELHVGVERELA
ncbi:26S proteasome subunit RPN7-domain-containing protein [Zopfochytrium polystomum]|nr:26S proteasome subunit RPN7-domain-containing protein [Zopfochytrium polystomum]